MALFKVILMGFYMAYGYKVLPNYLGGKVLK